MIDLPTVIGHRGAAAYAPENTLASLACAAELGCTWVEFDVHMTRDDVPVVIHDRNLKRTTGMDAMIDDIHSSQLMEIDAGSWFDPMWSGERIPTLAQALDACRVLGLTPNIEIKDEVAGRRAAARAVAETVRERWPSNLPRPLVSSFSLRVLYHMRTLAAEIPLGLLMWQTPPRFWTLHARILRCASIHVDRTLMSPAVVVKAKRRDRRLAVYTVNEAPDADAFLQQGADSLFSDKPDLLVDDDHQESPLEAAAT
jgi:glycerophosphoryl diester phosphodiesterase